MRFSHNAKSIVFIATVLLISLLSPASILGASAKNPSEGTKLKESEIQSYVSDMQPGWNLGNTFDAMGEDETSWGNPRVTKELIQQIAKQGYKSIRIPITWDQRMGEGPDYKIDPAFMDRVEEVVNWSLDAGLYVMINLHHDSWIWVHQMGENRDEVFPRYQAAWTQIAHTFKDHSHKLMFESINEPRFNSGWGSEDQTHYVHLDELNTSFHKIVRESGGKNTDRPLVLPTLETNAGQERLDELYQTIVKLDDPNLIATIHYYGFWPFSVNIAGFTTFEEQTKKDITDTFDRAYDTLVSKGIPVILGEYGLLGFDKNTGTIEQGEKLKFFEFLTHYVQEKNITHMLWDNGQHFNRTNLKWNDQDFYELMRASWKTRSATAESDLIFIKKGEKVQDTSIKLELNGNKLTGFFMNRNKGDKLHKGKDYTLSGNTLTLKANTLEKLTASGQYGDNAELTASFNKGADWTFDVILHDTPKLQSSEGSADSFAIPAAFNGDRLATMEAVYSDGTNAGPQNWTSYKEFGYAFTPSYQSNEIKLLENFFNEVNDGIVNLKFHFWSGEVLNYQITKNGNEVTGKVTSN
ncbi:cellulase family glycosylhydrolase [Mesobacillus foraminis]|uniref:Endoglucanase n=1 Tax=Mesobacillus foraminis TaxID=279826 RepID=A0A4R2BGM6_9BACI|nr:cellulase family glycosylhydrolase [Mesobacillus foraminis]TCN26198.1 endoglucanase [Mesobacillus foraminis]